MKSMCIPFFTNFTCVFPAARICFGFKYRKKKVYSLKCQSLHLAPDISKVHYESLKVLEWDKLCDLVSSFAATSIGRQATKDQLWSIHRTFQDSIRLLDETNAAVKMLSHGACRLDFTGIDLALVESSIRRARMGYPVYANEAMSIVALFKSVDDLQLNLKATIKKDADWYQDFMPLTEMIMEPVINRSLIKFIQQVIDEDGKVKDSASPALKGARNQVRIIEEKLYQLMDKLIRSEMKDIPSLGVSVVTGRWCIESVDDQSSSLKGLLLYGGSGTRNIVEPFVAVPLNDELQRARALAAKAEEDVLLMLTEKIQSELDDIEKTLNSVVQLDVINARARFSLSFQGTSPTVYLPEGDTDQLLLADVNLSGNKISNSPLSFRQKWKLYLPTAYHPLLVQKHRLLQKDRKKDSNVTDIAPVPVDFFIDQKTRVLVVTGPNTGGKTICLKTVGLAAMMAKSGLHVLSSESVQIPWFDNVFADIGDEQSLSQSLSTFSGHLKQISDIRSHSTDQSLVLLDEVGAGTNPLEGAALGMSLLESFAESGSFLTIATTHHGELKSLKYSDDAFENACMEFNEESLKPTYKILWGVPGRSNAINISENLGLPDIIISSARALYGDTSAEINEVINDMERFKRHFQELIFKARHHLMLSRDLRERLLTAKEKVLEHGTNQRYAKQQEILEAAAITRSILRGKMSQFRATTKPSILAAAGKIQNTLTSENQWPAADKREKPMKTDSSTTTNELAKQFIPDNGDGGATAPYEVKRNQIPKVGDTVHVSSLGKKATVIRVKSSKGEIIVQAGNMKLKLNLAEIKS